MGSNSISFPYARVFHEEWDDDSDEDEDDNNDYTDNPLISLMKLDNFG